MPFRSNFITKAIQERRSCPCPPLQVANGTRSMPGPQVTSSVPAEVVRTAWEPVRGGQAVPMIGEVGYDDAEPCFDE